MIILEIFMTLLVIMFFVYLYLAIIEVAEIVISKLLRRK